MPNGNAVSPNLILKHLISSVVILAKLVSSSVALPTELVLSLKSFVKFVLVGVGWWMVAGGMGGG